VQQGGTGRVLVVPGARFPSYLWGAPGDEMVQPLLKADWAVRNSIPLVPPNTVRLLDTIESALATGRGSPGLATLLSRAGIRPDIAEMCLGHAPNGIRGTYDRFQYLDEKASAFEALAALIERIVHPPPDVVVPIAGAKARLK